MLVPIVQMTKLTDPLKPLKWQADRQRRRNVGLQNDRKPRMTHQEARRDHREMLRLMACNAAGGALIGVVVGAVLFFLNVGGLWSLLVRAANPALPVLLVMVPFASLFAAAAAASAIFTLPYERKFREGDDGDHGAE